MPDPIGRRKFALRPNITKCIFCGAPPPLSHEHIFPSWCHQYLPTAVAANYNSFRGVRGKGVDQFYAFKRPGDIRHWQIQCVCSAKCNNGWMRRKVEDRARPILIPLFKGEDVFLTPDKQRLIASWAALKSMVAEFNLAGHATTNHMQRKRLMRCQAPPDGWGIWIGHFVTNPLVVQYPAKWESHPFLILPDRLAARRPDKRATYYNSQASTQVIGNLFIHILRAPLPSVVPRWRFATPDRGTLFRIWPPAKTAIRWPGQPMTDRDAIYTANAFMNFILTIQARGEA